MVRMLHHQNEMQHQMESLNQQQGPAEVMVEGPQIHQKNQQMVEMALKVLPTTWYI